MILPNLNFLQGGDIGAAPCQNCAVCYIRINEVIINLLKLFLPPQGFGPNGQNPRRHPRGPRIYIREKNFAIAEKISRTGLARYCRKVRKGLPNPRWGSKNTRRSLGVFARDSEVEREEMKKKIIQTSIWFRVKTAETHKAHSYRKFICWKSHRCPSDVEVYLTSWIVVHLR